LVLDDIGGFHIGVVITVWSIQETPDFIICDYLSVKFQAINCGCNELATYPEHDHCVVSAPIFFV
jgi:hypothetical protein